VKFLNVWILVLLAVIQFSSAAYAHDSKWDLNRRCQRLLTKPESIKSIVKLDFLTLEDVNESFFNTLHALTSSSKRVFERQEAPDRITNVIFHSLLNLHFKIARRYFYKPAVLEVYYEILGHLAKQHSNEDNFRRAYDNETSFEIYKEFASPMQYYFSLVMVSYLALRTDLPLDHRLKFVDLGIGTGDTIQAVLKIFKNAQIIPVDRSEKFIANYSEQFPGKPFLVTDFGKERLLIGSETQDVVISNSAASLCLSRKRFRMLLLDVVRILRPGGYFLFDLGGSHNILRKGESLEMFFKEMKGFGFDVEDDIGVGVQREDRVYFPILLRKRHRDSSQRLPSDLIRYDY